MHGAAETIEAAENGDAVIRAIVRFLGNDADGAQTGFGFAPQPAAQRLCLCGRADEERFLFLPKNPAREKFREKMMREKERDVEPGQKIEEENSRDKGVLCRDQVKNEDADARESLAKREAMLAQEFALQKIAFRALPTERLAKQTDDEHRAVNAI